MAQPTVAEELTLLGCYGKLGSSESIQDGIFRMSKRSEIIDGAQAPYGNRGIVYTEVLDG